MNEKHTLQPNNDEVCMHSRRKIFYVSTAEMNRDRPSRLVKTSVQGTQLLQSVKGVRPGVIMKRNLSCFCRGCRHDEECLNKAHVDEYTEVRLKMTHPIQDRNLEDGRRSKTTGIFFHVLCMVIIQNKITTILNNIFFNR